MDRYLGYQRPQAFSRLLRLSRPVLTIGLCVMAAVQPAQGGPESLRQPLPPPVVDPHSTEICLNSRISYHGGWTAAGTEQMLADVLHATAQAPVIGAYRAIYAATPQNVYLYDAGSHSLILHQAGNWRSDGTAAFEVGVAAENTLDAGAAMHLAQLESVALWTGTASQLASCPRASATTYANSNWNPADPIDIVISFGIRSVPGLTTGLVAISSDGSLPDPVMDGAVYLDRALATLAYDSTFAAENLGLTDTSQLLWAAYGCSNHWAAGSKGGLVCASAVANYYLTRRIYWVGPDGAYRFHNRLPPGTVLTTRDHRVELVTAGDVRPALRSAVTGLPDAPHYLILCVETAGAWQELEVGFAAMGTVLEASSLGLQGYQTADLSSQVQAGIRQATGIPAGDLPMVVVSLGRPAAGSDVAEIEGTRGDLRLTIANRLTFSDDVALLYHLPSEAAVHLAIYDCLGREVATLVHAEQGRGTHTARWNCRDHRGQGVLSGVYFCHLRAGNLAQGAQVVVVR